MSIKHKLARSGLKRHRVDYLLRPIHTIFRMVYGIDVHMLRRIQSAFPEQDLLMRTSHHLREELRSRFLPESAEYPCGDCIYILATGPSLSKISDKEKVEISKSLSVGMNRYVLFWKKFGIWPNYFFLGDKYVAAPEIFIEACNVILKEGKPIHFLVDEFFQGASPVTYPAIFFKRWHFDSHEARWAQSLDEQLFFWRGSLTCLINLICVLKIAPKIKLVGVDLNRPGSFFEREVQANPQIEDPINLNAAKLGVHSTAMRGTRGEAGIEAKWPYLMEQAKLSGVDVVCCNPNSLLVKSGVCPYEPIIA